MVDHDIYKWTHRPRFEEVIGLCNLEDGSKVLEVGIEPYIFSKRLLETNDQISLYGIGYGEGGESTKRILEHDVEIRKCNVEQDEWPYEDGKFDLVIMMAILEHLFDPVSALLEARRVLNEEGHFIATTPNAVSLAKRLTTLIGQNPFDDYSLESRYNRHQHEYTKLELENLLNICGLSVEEFHTVVENREWTIPRFVQHLSRIHPSLSDQLIVRCDVTEPKNELPLIYRQGLTEESDEHPSLVDFGL